MMKVAIIYLSFGGNTKNLALKIAENFERYGHTAHVYSIKDMIGFDEYDYCLFGSLTWENNGQQGKLPIPMRKYLKKILIEENHKINRCSVFGTGETQWGMENYCKAVDEMEYHLIKNNIDVDYKLKIEQNPIGNYKEKLTEDFVEKILKGIE